MLFTVFRTDSVEKINIWVATLHVGWNQHTQLQKIATILKKIVLQVVLPVFCVSSSRCCGFVWSLPSWYFLAILTFWLLYSPVNKNKGIDQTAVLCHRFSHVTKSGFLEARSLIVDITYLSVYWYQYFVFYITFCISLKRTRWSKKMRLCRSLGGLSKMGFPCVLWT